MPDDTAQAAIEGTTRRRSFDLFSVSHARRIVLPAETLPFTGASVWPAHDVACRCRPFSPCGALRPKGSRRVAGTPRATPSGAGHFWQSVCSTNYSAARNIRASAATRGPFVQDRADNPCSEGRGRRPLQGFSLLTSRGEQKAWQRETEQFRCRATRCWMLQIPAATRVTMSEQGIRIVSLP